MIEKILSIFATPAHAAADPLIVNGAGDVTTAVKDNVLGAVLDSDVLLGVAAVFGVILVVSIVMRLLKRGSR